MINNKWLERTTEAVELYQDTKFRAALVSFGDCLELIEAEAGDDHLAVCEALHNYAIACFALSKYDACRAALDKGLALALKSGDQNHLIMRACLLNAKARLEQEFENCELAEAHLLEAIDLSRQAHPAYAADITGNLIRFYSIMPNWREKAAPLLNQFEELHELNEPIEIFYDLLAGWRRPGASWDIPGGISAEALQARIYGLRAGFMYDSKQEARGDYEALIKLEEETRSVPPHMVVYSYLTLADMTFQTMDFHAAGRYCDAALKAIAGSYLRSHPGNYDNLMRAATYSILTTGAEKSRTIFDSAEKLVREELGEDNTHYTRCAGGKALMLPIFAAKGEDLAKEQERLFTTALKSAKNLYPPHHTWCVTLNTAMSDLYIRTSRFAEAEALLTETQLLAAQNHRPSEMNCRCLKSLADLRIKQKRMPEAQELLHQYEAVFAAQLHNPTDAKLVVLGAIAQQYLEANLLEDAERVHRLVATMSAPLGREMLNKANKHLALCLLRCGKAEEASKLLSGGDNQTAKSEPLSKRDQLVEASRQAWGMQTAKRHDEAKGLATQVVNEAHLLMPECEESLVMALAVLVEQAKVNNKADEILRLIAMLSDYEESIRLRCILPTFYLEAAQAFAKERNIRAEELFEKAMTLAEGVHGLVPQSLDNCCFAFMSFCESSRKEEKALQLCDRLIALRAASNGTESQEYASALSSKAGMLVESDANQAEAISREALQILEKLDDSASLQLFICLTRRILILEKMLRFEEGKEMKEKLGRVKAKLDKLFA